MAAPLLRAIEDLQAQALLNNNIAIFIDEGVDDLARELKQFFGWGYRILHDTQELQEKSRFYNDERYYVHIEVQMKKMREDALYLGAGSLFKICNGAIKCCLGPDKVKKFYEKYPEVVEEFGRVAGPLEPLVETLLARNEEAGDDDDDDDFDADVFYTPISKFTTVTLSE